MVEDGRGYLSNNIMDFFNIQRAFQQKQERKWDTLYWCVDLHGVIIEGKYNLNNEGAQIYPGAIEVLSFLTKRPDQKLILWTSSHAESVKNVLFWLASSGIRFDYINENPECPNTVLCDFHQKFYFNILLDDKAGFEGNKDWFVIKQILISIGEWK